ncbi:MAG: transposase [Frankia sp.]|nr:transposase [Frankia sp.]
MPGPGCPPAGYHDWPGRPPSLRDQGNELLTKQIERIRLESRGTYGWPRVTAGLALGLGVPVNHKRVARLLRQAGIQGVYRRRQRRGPVAEATVEGPARRQFAVRGPDRLWLAGITGHWRAT